MLLLVLFFNIYQVYDNNNYTLLRVAT